MEEHRRKIDDDKGQLDPHNIVRVLTTEIEKRLLALTINAPDW